MKLLSYSTTTRTTKRKITASHYLLSSIEFTYIETLEVAEQLCPHVCCIDHRTQWSATWMESLPDADNEGSNSTFQKFPAKTRIRIQLFKSFPPRRGFEFNSSARLTNSSSRRRPTRLRSMEPTTKQQQRRQASSRIKHCGSETQSGFLYELIEVVSSTRLQNKSVLILT